MDQVRLSSRYCYPKVTEVAAVLALAPPEQPWRHEAPVHHRIRILLILQGMPWGRADWIGHSLVARARIENGVRQPTGWDSLFDPHTWVIISCCPICDRPMRQSNRELAYCSLKCRARAEVIRQMIGHVSLRCWFCNEILIEPRADQKYCCEDHRTKASTARRVAEGRTLGQVNYTHRKLKAEQVVRETAQPRICPECGTALPPGAHRLKKFCGPECKRAAENPARTAKRAAARAAKLHGHAKPNGHDRHATNGSEPDARPNDTGGRERLLADRAGAGGSEAGAPRDDAAAGVAGS
jgi:hypothetical protein